MSMRIYFFLIVLMLTSCVPLRKYQEMKESSDTCYAENQRLKNELRELEENTKEYEARVKILQSDNADLKRKNADLTDDVNVLKGQLKRLKDSYDDIAGASSSGSDEIRALLKKVNDANKELIEREDRINALERKRREEQAKLQELQDALDRKDAAVRALKDKISRALLGFDKNGLSVNIKNGKVYVSMDNKLLFRSASWVVDAKGKQALDKLADVLAVNRDINVLVEGHTDNVPYRGNAQIKDNWDLSVKRSTSIIRILLQSGKIDGERLTAAGRSKYCPVERNNSAAARAKNRRTEIILTPKLDEIFEILN